MYGAALSVALLLWSTAALASSPCASPICDLTKPGGPALCTFKADWILEAVVTAVAEEHGPMCATNMGCTVLWRGGYVTLSADSVALTKSSATLALSGAIRPTKSGGIRIDAASHCWADKVRLDPAVIGKRVRFYGMDANRTFSTFVKVGYFAYEIVE